MTVKTVLITGGSRGIGAAAVRAFLREGWQVAFTYRASEEKAKELKREGKDRCFPIRCDFACQEEVEGLPARVFDLVGVPDVLINNAGIASYGLFQDLSSEAFDRLFQINFKSTYFITAGLAPGMIRRGSGKIINLSSIWGEAGGSCEVAYSAAKAAVNGFTRALAKELAPSGITVNAVAPGVVDTDMMAHFSDEDRRLIRDEIPCGRFASPEEVAEFLLFLAGDDASYLTGQIIGINGGMS